MEKKDEKERMDQTIREFEMVIAVLQDAMAYKEFLIKNKREVFYLEEKINEYESNEERLMEDILVRLDIIIIKKQTAEKTEDVELINEADELINFTKDKICMIRDNFPTYTSAKLYEKTCNIIGEEITDPGIDNEEVKI